MLSPEEQSEQNRQERLAALCESTAQLCDGLSSSTPAGWSTAT